MKIVNVKVNDLIPYENNPRNNDNAVEPVAKSIKEFGFKVPIIIDKDNVIVAGHTRYKASQMLVLEEVPCIIADDLTEEQIKAFRLADNKVGELATWDLDKLNLELEDLDIDMSDFGFEELNFDEEDETQNITDNRELDLDNYEDDKFNVECPKCGFHFNIKEEK